MNWATVWEVIKKFLPTKKIAAWVLGLIGLGVAALFGVQNTDLKDTFCSSAPVKLEVPAK